MSFTDGRPWVVTDKDCKAPWKGIKGGGGFRCTFCGHRFKQGDTARWQYTNDIPGAGGNPLVCVDCDGTKEGIAKEMKTRYAEAKGRMWYFSAKHFQ